MIGTHSGTFHCDEALACFMLKQIPKFSKAKIIRTRNDTELEKCDIVVDVGGIFDVQKNRFDHHQKGFNETFNEKSDIKLSSAGLVYKYFGKEILKNLFTFDNDDDLNNVYQIVYENFIKEIDAIDNGILPYDKNIKPLYYINTNITRRVAFLNPTWNDKSNPDIDALFQKAMELTGSDFVSAANYIFNEWLPAKKIVTKSFEERFKVDPSGKIMKLPCFCPWKKHLFSIKEASEVLYVLFEGYGDWRITAVPIDPNSFVSKKALPEQWRGLRDDALCKRTNIEGCVFVHATGFTGGNKTLQGILQMARAALKYC